jgi:hypothetical protein
MSAQPHPSPDPDAEPDILIVEPDGTQTPYLGRSIFEDPDRDALPATEPPQAPPARPAKPA